MKDSAAFVCSVLYLGSPPTSVKSFLLASFMNFTKWVSLFLSLYSVFSSGKERQPSDKCRGIRKKVDFPKMSSFEFASTYIVFLFSDMYIHVRFTFIAHVGRLGPSSFVSGYLSLPRTGLEGSVNEDDMWLFLLRSILFSSSIQPYNLLQRFILFVPIVAFALILSPLLLQRCTM